MILLMLLVSSTGIAPAAAAPEAAVTAADQSAMADACTRWSQTLPSSTRTSQFNHCLALIPARGTPLHGTKTASAAKRR